MESECLQAKWDAALLGGKGQDRVSLIKSSIYEIVRRGALRGAKNK